MRPMAQWPSRAVLIAGPTASGKSALALDVWRRSSAASSSMPIPCRSIAICASSPRGRRRTRRRAHRTNSTAMSMRRRTIRSGAGCRDVAEVLTEHRQARPHADPGRRHRALFQGADRRARCRTADPGRHSRQRARAARTARARRPCTPNLCGSIRRPRIA